MAIVNDIQGGPFWATSPIIWFQTYRPFNGYSRFRLDKIFSPVGPTTDTSNWEFRVGLHKDGTQVTQSLSLRYGDVGKWFNFRQTNGNLHHPVGVTLAIVARFVPATQNGYGQHFQGDLDTGSS